MSIEVVRASTEQQGLDANRVFTACIREMGHFMPRSYFTESARERNMFLAQQRGNVVGFVIIRHARRLGHVTIADIAVLLEARRGGAARLLVSAVRAHAEALGAHAIKLKCPEDIPANKFYASVGFLDRGLQQSKRKKVRLWEMPLSKMWKGLNR